MIGSNSFGIADSRKFCYLGKDTYASARKAQDTVDLIIIFLVYFIVQYPGLEMSRKLALAWEQNESCSAGA